MIVQLNSPSKPNPTQKSITLNIKQTKQDHQTRSNNNNSQKPIKKRNAKIKNQIKKRVLPEQSHSHNQAALEQRYHDELHHYQTQVMKNIIK